MVSQKEQYTIEQLVKHWQQGSLSRNDEYQRGASWRNAQMQGLVDSVFRGYPIPPLFLHEIQSETLAGQTVSNFQVIDGQQRIRALSTFLADKFALLASTDRKLRLPERLRSSTAPWGAKRFSELSPELRERFLKTKIDTFIITAVDHLDEVRDLFIRLQSGTALSRQQVRDAWPGDVGPYVEKLAGKLDREPKIRLFKLIDGRGLRSDGDEDQHDQYVNDRQFCAQLLCLFLAREIDPIAEQSVGANELDKLYHDYTTLSDDLTSRFEKVLRHTTSVCAKSLECRARDKFLNGSRLKKKFKSMEVKAVFLLIQDLLRNPQVKLDPNFHATLGALVASQDGAGRSTSGPKISAYYREWRAKLPEDIATRLDPRRIFSPAQRAEMFERQQGLCAKCHEPIRLEEAEADHCKAHTEGGRTDMDNGRLVHVACHERAGRPPADNAEQVLEAQLHGLRG